MPDKLDSLFNRLKSAIPAMSEDAKVLLKEKGQSLLASQGFVTRETFEAQTRVLEQTRAKVEALEQKITELENLMKKDL